MRFCLKYTRGFHTMCNTCFNSCRSCQSCNSCNNWNSCNPCNTCNTCGGLFRILFGNSCGHRCGCGCCNRCGCEQARNAAAAARIAAANACRCAAVAAQAAARAAHTAQHCNCGCRTNTCGLCGTNTFSCDSGYSGTGLYAGFDAYYARQYRLYPYAGNGGCNNSCDGD